MEGGWVAVEMANLTSYVAKLIQNELLRFNTIYAIVTDHVINDDIDCEDQVKRMQEKGIDSYIENQSDKNQVGTSPILKELAINAKNQIYKCLNE